MDCPTTATKTDVEAHFNTHGTGEITEIKLMNGFGFIEYKDAMDARDVVPGKSYCYTCISLKVHSRLIVCVAFRRLRAPYDCPALY